MSHQTLMGRPPKLTPAQVRRLREWAANRRTAVEMARELGISTSVLWAYLRGDRKSYPEDALP